MMELVDIQRSLSRKCKIPTGAAPLSSLSLASRKIGFMARTSGRKSLSGISGWIWVK
jgi:hypothetical protein